MISRAAGDAGREKNMSQNIIESSENLEPWNMFTLNLVTPKTEPDDSFEPEIVVPEKDAFSVYLTSSAEGQSSEFIIPKIEPVNPGSDEESSCKMDCSTFEPSGWYDIRLSNEWKQRTDEELLDEKLLNSDQEDDLDSNFDENWFPDEEEEDEDEDGTIIVVPNQQLVSAAPWSSTQTTSSLLNNSNLVHTQSSVWTSNPEPPTVIHFSGNPGLKVIPDSNEPIDYFLLLFSDKIMDLILDATNFQAGVLSSQSAAKPKSRIRGWKDLTRGDLEVFLGLLYMTGQVHAPTYGHHWQNNLLYNYPVFRNAMSRDKFFLILRALHFVSPVVRGSLRQSDPLYKIQPLLDIFHNRMAEIYYPFKELVLDQSVLLWRNRLYFKSTKEEYRIKFYVLAQTDGLVLKTRIYCGSANKVAVGHDYVDQVLKHLLKDYLGVGHAVYMDNCYSGVEITKHLLDQRTYVTGSLKANRKGNPNHVVNKELKLGEVEAAYTKKGICVLKWRNFLVISSEFGASKVKHSSRSGRVVHTPEAVLKYNKNVNGAVQLMAYYPNQRRSLRWYAKVGIHVFHIIMNNAYLLHRKFSCGKKYKLIEFRERVITSLIYKHRPPLGAVETPKGKAYHIPKPVPRNEKNRKLRKRCVVCSESGLRVQSGYFCSVCPKQPGLCLEHCFAKYHKYKEP